MVIANPKNRAGIIARAEGRRRCGALHKFIEVQGKHEVL
jgi:hypothetical protein